MLLPQQTGEIIVQRYRILDILGQGGVGITYSAEEIATGNTVAVKVLSLQQIKDFKTLELFQREAKILAQLNHPAIPHYLNYFQVDADKNSRFYLVQELATGQSLGTLIEQGWHADETEVREIAIQILDILQYLQQLIPPVIHRDIKPENIIRRDDGKIFLVDFGAVQDVYHNTFMGSSTVVGTYGYMAPEQFRGQAVLATDLYGLGTTLIYLLTRKCPADLPQHKLKIQFQSHVQIERKFAQWLKRMIEPATEDRFASATEALTTLQDEKPLNLPSITEKYNCPTFSKINYLEHNDKLIIEIPPVWFSTIESSIIAFLIIVFLFLTFWFFFGIKSVSDYLVLSPLVWIFPIIYGFGTVSLLIFFVKSATSRVYLELGRDNLRLQEWLLGLRYQNIYGKTLEMSEWKSEKVNFNIIGDRKYSKVLIFRIKRKKYRFGILLNEIEKRILIKEVNNFLQD
jgi:eukaryotic-like serine/threonine-protein kinase